MIVNVVNAADLIVDRVYNSFTSMVVTGRAPPSCLRPPRRMFAEHIIVHYEARVASSRRAKVR